MSENRDKISSAAKAAHNTEYKVEGLTSAEDRKEHFARKELSQADPEKKVYEDPSRS